MSEINIIYIPIFENFFNFFSSLLSAFLKEYLKYDLSIGKHKRKRQISRTNEHEKVQTRRDIRLAKRRNHVNSRALFILKQPSIDVSKRPEALSTRIPTTTAATKLYLQQKRRFRSGSI